MIDLWLGGGGPGQPRDRADVLPRPADAADADHGHDRAIRRHQLRQDVCRPLVHRSRKCSAARQVAVIGYGPYEALFEKRGIDPIGKPIRIGSVEYTVIGVVGKRPSPGGLRLGADDFAIVPYTAFRKQFGSENARRGPFGVVPVDDRGAAEGRRVARRGDARGRSDHAHSPRPDARQAERLRPRHRRTPSSRSGSRFRRRSCCRWS